MGEECLSAEPSRDSSAGGAGVQSLSEESSQQPVLAGGASIREGTRAITAEGLLPRSSFFVARSLLRRRLTALSHSLSPWPPALASSCTSRRLLHSLCGRKLRKRRKCWSYLRTETSSYCSYTSTKKFSAFPIEEK